MIFRTAALIVSAAIAMTACQDRPTAPRTLSASNGVADRSTGDTPNYNLELILRPAGTGDGFGHVKFRQDGNDGVQRIDLGVWVRDLEPGTEYLLQRAVDANLDGVCTGTNWLTLGEGPVPQSITTDDRGSAKQDLFRVVLNPPGSTFDIIQRIIRKGDATMHAVLISDCFQFSVR